MRRLFVMFAFFFASMTLLQAETSDQKCVLVVGGAGYIGSHVNEMLHRKGYQMVVLDNLSRGYRDTVLHGDFIEGDIADPEVLHRIFTHYRIDAVMHFAAFMNVGESMKEPLKYYINNVLGTLNLLEVMRQHRINHFIFSSSSTIFGVQQEEAITESHPCHPINPYGNSKLMIETVLHDLDHAYGLKFCCLRYFNAAGGDPRGEIKNYKVEQTNLIPIVLRSLQQPDGYVTIFGTDYPTPDGTCIRDYVHVEDLGTAHIAAMEQLFQGAPSACYNLGNGKGFSVREVIAAVEKVTGLSVKVVEGPRRPGDPAVLVADASKATRKLGWEPKYFHLEKIIEDAWRAMN